MTTVATRQLGSQPGIQLNPLRDNTDGFAAANSDQVFGIAMRATRGRIDKPFRVNKGNFLKKLGSGESMRMSALNEAHIQVYEALNKGAAGAVVQRLTTDAAVLKYVIVTGGAGAILIATVVAGAITAVAVTNGGSGYPSAPPLTVVGAGTGAVLAATVVAGVITAVAVTTPGTGYTTAPTITPVADLAYSVSPTLPETPFLMAIKLLDCVNEGALIEIHADAVTFNGMQIDTQVIVLRVRDILGNLMYEIAGSLDPAAIDDYSQSLFLPDVAERLTDAVELTVSATATISKTSSAYGRDQNGRPRLSVSGVLVYFIEGGTGYTSLNYAAACAKLKSSPFDFGYISGGGTQSPALISQLAQLGYDTNTQFPFDVPGTLDPAAAIAFVAALNLDSQYPQAYWSPLKSDDPLGINGKLVLGTATYNIALRCQRNAQKNAKGFAPKNFPIAGKDWPLARTGIEQIYSPDPDTELSDLADAKINPVLSETYNGGSEFVFTDSLTCAKTVVSFKKLIAVAEMSSTVDDWVTRFGKQALQYPMSVTLKMLNDYLKTLFEGAQAAGWIVPSSQMNGAAFQFLVAPNEQKPADLVDVTYSLRYDGTTRQITVTQTLSR